MQVDLQVCKLRDIKLEAGNILVNTIISLSTGSESIFWLR